MQKIEREAFYMARLNAAKLIKKTTINPRYDVSILNVQEVFRISDYKAFSLFDNSFRLGYAQGMKAAKAEMRGKKTA